VSCLSGGVIHLSEWNVIFGGPSGTVAVLGARFKRLIVPDSNLYRYGSEWGVDFPLRAGQFDAPNSFISQPKCSGLSQKEFDNLIPVFRTAQNREPGALSALLHGYCLPNDVQCP